jgi:hypothetical protein
MKNRSISERAVPHLCMGCNPHIRGASFPSIQP